MNLAPFPWQTELWQQQIDKLRAGRLPQSLLIVGARGTGKAEFARQLAKVALCRASEDKPCDVCTACRTFEAGGQADWLEVRRTEDKKEILIDQVRSFCAGIQLTANSQAGRYALIHEADRLNRAAANALLKTLEEPPNGAHIVLTAEQISRIPATIRSRCNRIMMPRPNLSESRTWLGTEYSEVPDAVLARLGPVEIQRQKDNLPELVGHQRQWSDVLDGLKHDNDPIKAAASIKEPEFDEFLRWWQEQLLQLMKEQTAAIGVKRLWDSLLKIRRQGQGGSINRLLALEGLFILYIELVQQASR